MPGVAAPALSPAQANAILQAALSRLHVELTGPSLIPAGSPIKATVAGAATELDVSDLLNGVGNLDSLVYSNALLSNLANLATVIAGEGSDVKNLATGALSGLSSGGNPPDFSNLAAANPTGTLSRLFAEVAIPKLRVRVDIHWHVTDLAGTVLKEGTDFLAPAGMTSPSVELLIRPLFQPFTLNSIADPLACAFFLTATVALTIGSTTISATLPPPSSLTTRVPIGIPIRVLPILIPTVAVLFSNPNFDPAEPKWGLVLIVVPQDSPLGGVDHLNALLKKIDDQVQQLRDLPSMAASLLGLDALSNALGGQPGVRFATAAALPKFPGHVGVPEMESYDYYQGTTRIWWVPISDFNVDFDDAARSAIVIGMPGTSVRFFNDDKYQTGAGSWTLTIPPITPPQPVLPFAIVPELGGGAQDADGNDLFQDFAGLTPATIPPNCITAIQNGNQLARRISSMEFISQGKPPQCARPSGGTIGRSAARSRANRAGVPPRSRPRKRK
jgi:hypothetical protein